MKQKLIDRARTFVNQWNVPAVWVEQNQKISVIIPVYYPEHLEAVLKHLHEIERFHEIILVDDSGAFTPREYANLKHENVTVLYHARNLGRPAARNSGAAWATGDILLFLDQDMFLAPDFPAQARRHYQTNPSLIFLGLRDTVPYVQIPRLSAWRSPDPEKDWRFQTVVSPYFLDLTVQSVGGPSHRCQIGKVLRIADETENLQKMGIDPDNTLGFWDLPSMVISHTMAISAPDYRRIGGFPEWIQGWGGEDIVLGFLACACHLPICLSRCVSYQAMHRPYSGSEAEKLRELDRNIARYKRWAREADVIPERDWKSVQKRAALYNKGNKGDTQ